MNIVFLHNAAGFIIGAVTFAIVFSDRTRRERGIFLSNCPAFRDRFSLLLPVGLGVIIGVGGFGPGAIAGMIFVFVRAHRARGRDVSFGSQAAVRLLSSSGPFLLRERSFRPLGGSSAEGHKRTSGLESDWLTNHEFSPTNILCTS